MFFSKKNSGSDGFGAGNGKAITSIVGKDMSIVGDVTFKGKVRLEGRLEGNIKGEYLVLASTGNVKGDIEAHSVVCQGRVEGKVKVKQLFMKKGGILSGNIETVDLLVENGAILNGEVRAKVPEPDNVSDTATVHAQGEAGIA